MNPASALQFLERAVFRLDEAAASMSHHHMT